MAEKISLVFPGNNKDLLKVPAFHGKILYFLDRRASIKDIIEAVGVPHTEICRLEHDGKEISFQYIPSGNEEIIIYPFDKQNTWQAPSALRPQPFDRLKFLVDVTALKLARNLRMAGFDTTTVTSRKLRDIVKMARSEERIVITRNRELVKIGELHFAQLIRSDDHREQLLEVEERYGLSSAATPMSRCLVCNEALLSVPKEKILHRLEPLTRKYFTTFKECSLCRKIYWPGSHHDRMIETFDFLWTK
jgi:hypothetical protein